MSSPWVTIEDEARDAFHGPGRFPLPPYSEYMPPPYIGIKPAAPDRAALAATCTACSDAALDVDEYEQASTLEPGLDHLAEKLATATHRLLRGEPHGLSATLLDGNPAWPAELAAAARGHELAHDPQIVICALALSRSQDDKGRQRWTLFGASHEGSSAAFWHGRDEAACAALLAWAGIPGPWQVYGDDVPAALAKRAYRGATAGLHALITFTPFAALPREVRAAYLAGELVLVPTPPSLVWFEHPRYRELARELPRATQIPLLHLFPHVENSCALRIPQSGWLDETDPANIHGHRVVNRIARPHRWERVARDADVHGDFRYTDAVSVALFSTTPEAIDLYNKPLARNAQVWTEDYRLLLDGPRAGHAAIAHAAGVIDRGGRFGYRMYYPPMRAGLREVFWHLPLIARGRGVRYEEGA